MENAFRSGDVHLVTYNKHAKQSQDCYVIKFKGASGVHIYLICFCPIQRGV